MPLQPSARARLTTALVLFLVLVSGVLLGVAADRQLEARGVTGQEARRPADRPGMDERPRGFDPRGRSSSRDSAEGRDPERRRPSLLFDQVGLTEDQMAQVDSIVGFYRVQMRELHEEFNEAYTTRFRELNQQARAEVRAVLTAEQQILYDSIRAEWELRRQERRQDSLSDRAGASGER